MNKAVRINKYLADQGICSRREADVLIGRKQVLINGAPAVIGQVVQPHDTVTLKDTTKLPTKTYLAYYKGRGIITHSPAAGEVDIASRLKQDFGLNDVYPVGRLDKDSEGLLLLSDDGRLTGPLLDPKNAVEKEYHVWVDKPVTKRCIDALAAGVNIEGYLTKPARATRHPSNRQRLSLVLTEGKKHQIRRMCAALGYQVQTLKRVRIMHIELGKLKPNQFRKLTKPEVTALLTTLHIPTQ